MNKDNKKKVAGGAAVATAAAGAVVAGAANALAHDNNSVEAVAEGTPIAEGEDILEGLILPEVVIPGTAPTKDGGELPGFTATGHAPTPHAQEPAATHQHAPTVGHQTAETEHPMAQQGSLMEDNKQEEPDMEDNKQEEPDWVPQDATDSEEQGIPGYAFDPEQPYPGNSIDPEERGNDLFSNGNGQEHIPDYQPNAHIGDIY